MVWVKMSTFGETRLVRIESLEVHNYYIFQKILVFPGYMQIRFGPPPVQRVVVTHLKLFD